MAALAFFVFIDSDQGAEVLRALGERRFSQQALTGATGVVRLMAFGTGTLLWCLASWYTARVLLYANLPTTLDLYVDEDDNWSTGYLWLARNVPRILGAAPLAIIGYSMLHAVGTYEVDPPILLRVLGVCALVGVIPATQNHGTQGEECRAAAIVESTGSDHVVKPAGHGV